MPNGQRRVVADSSSLILLQKSQIFHTFLKSYSVIIARSVYDELNVPQKKGAGELVGLLRDVVKNPLANHRLAGMGAGESCSIHLYNEGYGDFMLLDDRKAANYCKARDIPFVNSLLLPRILYGAAIIDERRYRLVTNNLIEDGYYSERIIAMAGDISAERLRDFFP